MINQNTSSITEQNAARQPAGTGISRSIQSPGDGGHNEHEKRSEQQRATLRENSPKSKASNEDAAKGGDYDRRFSSTAHRKPSVPCSSVHSVAAGEIVMEAVGALQLSSVRLTLSCYRCRDASERFISVPHSFGPDGESLVIRPVEAPVVAKQECPKCQLPAWVELKPMLLLSQGSNEIAEASFWGGRLTAFRPSFLVKCGSCSTTMLCEDILPGERRSLVCRACYGNLSFLVSSIQWKQGMTRAQKTVAAVARSASVGASPRISRKGEPTAFHIGDPLPGNGACTHDRKSYRWNRYSCCTRIFPCDECHRAAVQDHSPARADRIICGFCSREQPYSEKPCSCGRALTGGSGTHWEGGRGCRDPIRMSRKDERKYKGVRRTAEGPAK